MPTLFVLTEWNDYKNIEWDHVAKKKKGKNWMGIRGKVNC